MEVNVEAYFMEAIKVIPEIIKVKRIDARRWIWLWRQCFEKKMIIEKHILQVDLVKNLLRILPPLTITTTAIDTFIVVL
jgi:acetylornithine aminotransferase